MCDGEGASKLLFFFETVHVVKKLDSAAVVHRLSLMRLVVPYYLFSG